MSSSDPTILFLCTGNAARSVMAAAMLRNLDTRVSVTSAGTHSIPGLPMSTRTRTALGAHGVEDRDHRSAQLDQDMVDDATVIAIFEPMHLSYMRKKHPDAIAKVASLARFVRDLPDGPEVTLAERTASLDLGSHTFEEWEEIIDPAGGELPEFEAAAAQIQQLIDGLRPKLGAFNART